MTSPNPRRSRRRRFRSRPSRVQTTAKSILSGIGATLSYRIYLVAAAVALVSSVCGRAADPDLTLSIAIPHIEEAPGVLRWGLRQESPPFIHVILTNRSANKRRVFQEWCSWGWGALTFELMDEKRKTWFPHKLPKFFTYNFPAYWTLNPGESYVFDVDFANRSVWGDGFWLPPDHPTGLVTLRAVYDVRADDESRKLNVWAGRITSEPAACIIK